jgi:hypothetical protein
MNEGKGERISNLKWMEREWSGVGVALGGRRGHGRMLT